MIRKIGFNILCASCLLATNAFSTGYHSLAPGMFIEYELPINDPQIFFNIFFWELKASCTILTDAPNAPVSPLLVTMLRKKGSVNAIPLFTGEKMGLTVHPGDTLDITADSGAKVELVNLGEKSIRASCSAS
jgi:hypothetical protein